VMFDRDKFRSAYERHNEEVTAYFSNRPGDLLRMDIITGHGWELLCPFLHVPVPNIPFPKLNAKDALVDHRSLAR
jgi:hypothetical protein